MGNRLPPKNITSWIKSYVSGSSQGNILISSTKYLQTNSGNPLILNPNIYTPKNITSWTKATKNPTSYRPLGGNGYVVVQTATNISDNLGNLLTDNNGNFIVPNPTYVQPKNATAWTPTGA